MLGFYGLECTKIINLSHKCRRKISTLDDEVIKRPAEIIELVDIMVPNMESFQGWSFMGMLLWEEVLGEESGDTW